MTGRDLYDQLGSTLINGRGWTLDVAIDGDDTDNTLLFDETSITRTNKDSVGGTEKGVLTQVYVDNTAKRAYVVIINTYLAIASEDYDSKNGEVDLDVYHLDNTGTTKNPEYIKADVNGISVTVEDEDIDVSDVVDGDMFLVTVADGKIQSMAAPEVLADSEISSFKRDSDVVSEGKTYEYADTAKYDVEVLEEYAQTNLKDTTYNIILDQYGYLIGLEQNEEADQYVFLTGMNGNTSDLATKNADANVIFLDGSMKTVTVNVDKSKFLADTESGPQMNTWCTYSVDSKDVYTLKEVVADEPSGWKVAQNAQDVTGSNEVKIDKKNVSLKAVSGNAYGNDDTVYLNVETKAIKAATAADSDKPWTVIINDVDSRVVGARNASLTVTNQFTASSTGTADGSDKDQPLGIEKEIYTLYKENGYIIAAVTVEAEDDGLNKVFAYIHSDDVKRESYDKANDEWTWVREAIVDGKITDLKEVGGGTDLSVLEEDLDQGSWYELKLDADGNVTSATEQTFAAFNDSTNPDRIDNVDDVDDAVNAKDTVIMQVSGMVEGTNKLTYKNGTLYTEKDDTEGFSVSPDVKTVLCLSDGEGNLYDDCDDRYTGRKGLEDAIKNLDSNFTGELNVVFDKGDAVVIILVDGTDAADNDDDDIDDGTVQPQGEVSIGGDFVKTPPADQLTGDSNTGNSNQTVIKGWNDGAYVLPNEINKNTVLDGDVNGDLNENIIFKWQSTADSCKANLVIKDKDGNVVYREQFVKASGDTATGAGHFFVVRVTYREDSGEEWYATTNSTGFGPLTKGPLAVGDYTWEITGTNVLPVDGAFTISK